MSELKLKALKARYTAKRLEALSKIEVVMESKNSADDIDVLDGLIQDLNNSIRIIQTIDSVFKVENAEPPSDNQE
jgi:hypothetical protein